MGLKRRERLDEVTKNNGDGLVAVQMPDGTMKHITREEWPDFLEEVDEYGAENQEPQE